MSNQTPINRLEGIREYQAVPVDNNINSESGSVRRVLADITELAELQARLVASDVNCLAGATLRPLVIAMTGLVLAVGSLPVLLLSGANFMVQRFNWTLPTAQFVVAGTAALIAILICLVATKRLRQCGSPFHRSIAELEKNMETLREMLGGKSMLNGQWKHTDRSERNN